jgi:hypothetical protein
MRHRIKNKPVLKQNLTCLERILTSSFILYSRDQALASSSGIVTILTTL